MHIHIVHHGLVQDGYFKDMAGPVALTFVHMTLSAYEWIEIWAPDEAYSTEANNQLTAFNAERRTLHAESAASTALSVAPDSPRTAELVETAERAAETVAAISSKLTYTVDTTYGILTPKSEAGAQTATSNPAEGGAAAGEGDAGDAGGGGSNSGASAGGQQGVGADADAQGARQGDGAAQQRLHMLARFDGGQLPGSRPPETISSITSEVLLVYRCEPPFSSEAAAWTNLTAAIEEVDLPQAVRTFQAAAAAQLRGFYRQDIRRVLYAAARRAARRDGRLHAALFPGGRGRTPASHAASHAAASHAPSGTATRHEWSQGSQGDGVHRAGGLGVNGAAHEAARAGVVAADHMEESGFAAAVDEAITMVSQVMESAHAHAHAHLPPSPLTPMPPSPHAPMPPSPHAPMAPFPHAHLPPARVLMPMLMHMPTWQSHGRDGLAGVNALRPPRPARRDQHLRGMGRTLQRADVSFRQKAW